MLIGIIAAVLGCAVWIGLRRLRVPRAARPPSAAVPLTAQPTRETANTGDEIDRANDLAAQRLWRLAFAAPSQEQAAERMHARVRDNVMAMLQVDTLDANCFPRRPALMPQLLQAVNDPDAASEKLSRIVAHDPVLAADVLRLANSSHYRTSPAPIETIQRAIVVCGLDALRAMLAAAMLMPVFRATRKNFPRFPRLLWERTERASRAAELYALATHPEDRFEAQLAVLLGALGPLVVYGATLDVYARNAHIAPSSALCVTLIDDMAVHLSLRIARDWRTSPRLLAALAKSPAEPLAKALAVGELLGTLAFLESQTVIAREERIELLNASGLPAALTDPLWSSLTGAPAAEYGALR